MTTNPCEQLNRAMAEHEKLQTELAVAEAVASGNYDVTIWDGKRVRQPKGQRRDSSFFANAFGEFMGNYQ